MDQYGQDIVCEHCGTHLSVDLDFCLECGKDRGTGPAGSPTAPDIPPAGEAPPPAMMAPPVAVPRGRMSVGTVLGVIGLVLAVVAIASISWFVGDSTDGDVSMSFGLREIEIKYDDGSATEEQRETYATLERQMGGEELKMDDVAHATFWLLVVGLILAALFILFALFALIGMFRGSASWLPILTGMVAGLLLVIAAAYFGISFQDSLEEDFDISLADQEDAEYGLGAVWYLALFGGILVLCGALLTKAPTAHYGRMEPMRQG